MFLKNIDINNACMFSITDSNTYGWFDRNLNLAEVITKFWFDERTDLDKDGYIEPDEILEKAIEISNSYNSWLKLYLENEYKGFYPKDRPLVLKPFVKIGEEFKSIKISKSKSEL